jgi:hypothetical protein
MPNLTWPHIQAELLHLWDLTLLWLLTSPWGKYVLVFVLLFLVMMAVKVIHGNVKADDSFNIRMDL